MNLNWMFTYYNKKYFGNLLPKYKVVFAFPTMDRRCAAEEDVDQKIIRINPRLKGFYQEVKVCLLHEMIHAKLDVTGAYTKWHKSMQAWHGPVFQKEIMRLFKAGAYKGIL